MTDVRTIPLTFGTATLGNLRGAVTDEDAMRILERAWELGVRRYDTAPHYGLGLAERRLGRFLADKPRGEFSVSTKVGRLLEPSAEVGGRDSGFLVPATHRRVWDPSPIGIRRSLEESLQRLGLDRVDTLYLHDPDDYDFDASMKRAIPALAELQRTGVIDQFGIGTNRSWAAERTLTSYSATEVMLAGKLTLLDHSDAAKFAELASKKHVRVAVAAVFNSGVLSSATPDSSRSYNYGAVTPDVLRRARSIAEVANIYDVDLPTVALHFARLSIASGSVVVGAATVDQLVETAGRYERAVPRAVWYELRARGLIDSSWRGLARTGSHA